MKKNSEEKILITKSSGNVYADLGLSNPEERLVKAELAFKINRLIKKKKLKQLDAAKLLLTDQSKISLLSCGQLSTFSIARLVKYLNLLHQDVEVVIKQSKHRKRCGSFRVVNS